MGGGASRWRRAETKQFGYLGFHNHKQISSINTQSNPRTISSNAAEDGEKLPDEAEQCGFIAKSLCAICLDPLTCTITTTPSSAPADTPSTFTAECSHTFHLTCIASNVRHGSITCPICRAHWSHLPRHHLATTTAFTPTTPDPVLQILEASIATSRVNRRSSLRSSARLYDDDDPIDPLPLTAATPTPRLHLGLVPTTAPYRLYLSIKLAPESPADLVLVVCPNGPHLRLLKQAMSLVVFALCSSDRLAIVTYSAAAAARAFPLRRMSPPGKQSALRIIDRLFYLGPAADPVLGFQKGVKVLEDRCHRNSNSCILHLSDSPAGQPRQLQIPVPAHRFHVGFGFGVSNGFVMHEFQEFLGRLMGGVVREAKVKIGFDGEWTRLGEVRGGEERRILVDLKEECEFVCVSYSYVKRGGLNEELITGEMVVRFEEKGESHSDREMEVVGGGGGGGVGRTSCVESWDYFDPFMARRWAKHLHRA